MPWRWRADGMARSSSSVGVQSTDNSAMAYLILASRGIGYLALVPNRQTVSSAAPDWWMAVLEIMG